MSAAMITDRAKPLALQAILFFVMAKADGKTRLQAITEFCDGEVCRAFGDTLTVGNVYGLAFAAGYTDN